MAQQMPTPGQQRRGVLAPVIGLIGVAICGLIVLGIVTNSVGAGGVIVGALCAMLPVVPVVATFLWIDRWEPEPPRLLLFAFLWGACVAAMSAILINSGAVLVAEQLLGTGTADLLGAVLVAPVVEEAVKGAFLVGLLVFRRREIDGIIDGIVYAGLVAAGFAFTENILYIGRAFAEEQMAGPVVGVLLVRGVLSPFAHPLFTAMTGIAVGLVAPSRHVAVRVLAVALGYAAAVCLHALWNYSASLGSGGEFFAVYGVVMVPLFLAVVVLVLWSRRREQQTVAAELPGFAQAGWIAQSEVPLLASMAGRQRWKGAVRRRSGKRVARAVGAYQAAVTELAFLRRRIARGSVGASAPYWHDQAVRSLLSARATAVGHPEALTVAIRHHAPPGWVPPGQGPPGQGLPGQGPPGQGPPSHRR